MQWRGLQPAEQGQADKQVQGMQGILLRIPGLLVGFMANTGSNPLHFLRALTVSHSPQTFRDSLTTHTHIHSTPAEYSHQQCVTCHFAAHWSLGHPTSPIQTRMTSELVWQDLLEETIKSPPPCFCLACLLINQPCHRGMRVLVHFFFLLIQNSLVH